MRDGPASGGGGGQSGCFFLTALFLLSSGEPTACLWRVPRGDRRGGGCGGRFRRTEEGMAGWSRVCGAGPRFRKVRAVRLPGFAQAEERITTAASKNTRFMATPLKPAEESYMTASKRIPVQFIGHYDVRFTRLRREWQFFDASRAVCRILSSLFSSIYCPKRDSRTTLPTYSVRTGSRYTTRSLFARPRGVAALVWSSYDWRDLDLWTCTWSLGRLLGDSSCSRSFFARHRRSFQSLNRLRPPTAPYPWRRWLFWGCWGLRPSP